MGLSEITLHGDWVDIVERDNQVAGRAATRKLYRAPAAKMVPADLGTILPVVTMALVRDLLPDMQSLDGYALERSRALQRMQTAPAGW